MKTSFLQNRILNFSLLNPKATTYHLAFTLKMKNIDSSLYFKEAMTNALKPHAILRSSFFEGDESWKVEILPIKNCELLTWTEIETNEFPSDFTSWTHQPFSLTPPWVKCVWFYNKQEKEALLLFITHHAVWDGGSVPLIIKSLEGEFNQASDRVKIELNNYYDFIQKKNDSFQDEVDELIKKDPLNLPYDFNRPKKSKFQGRRVYFTVEADKIKNLAERNKSTPFEVSFSLLKILINKYTQEERFNLAVTSHNRRTKEAFLVLGPLVKTEVVDCSVNTENTFYEVLESSKKVAAQIRKGTSTISKILPEVLFTFQNNFKTEIELNGLVTELNEIECKGVKCPLELGIYALRGKETQQKWQAYFEYDTELFLPETVTRMVESYNLIIDEVFNNNGCKVKDISAINSFDKNRMLLVWNKTEVLNSPKRLLHQYFEETATKYPSNIALIFNEQAVTYLELEKAANSLSHQLINEGIDCNDLVPVIMDRSIEMVVSLYAILKCGAAYVPFDPHTPKQRLDFLLADINTKVILTNIEGLQVGTSAKLIYPSFTELLKGNLNRAVINKNENDIAYLIYTSGSTGTPKGAMVHHAGIVNRLLWMQKEYQLTFADRVLQKTPYTFDVSVWEFFWPLMVGATLVISKPNGHKDPIYLKQIILEKKITVLHFVPSMLEFFLEEWDNTIANNPIKKVICSGEALTGTLSRKFFNKMEAELHNLYGPTEASVDVSYYQCDENYLPLNIPIGKPIDNCTLYILDKNLSLVNVGVIGELYIGGVGVGLGYYNREDLTKQKFINHPNFGRLYATNDLCKFLNDGNIIYLGRSDFQVKHKGLRIELGEIETHVRTIFPNIDCRVNLFKGESDYDTELELFLADVALSNADIITLKQKLLLTLPEYMVPSAFYTVKQFPTSSSGKLDMKMLRTNACKIELGTNQIENESWNESEIMVGEIWETIFGKKIVSKENSFFELGGDSLKALKLRAILRKRGFTIDLEQIWKSSKLVDMVSHLKKIENHTNVETVEKSIHAELMSDTNIENSFEATSLQTSMLYNSQKEGNGITYKDSFHFTLDIPWNEERFKEVLRTLVVAHPALRSGFTFVNDGTLLQVVYKNVELPLEVFPIDSPLHLVCNKSWDITQYPLFKIDIIPLSNSFTSLTLSFHHAILDGWSVSVILTQLLRNYLGKKINIATTYPQLAHIEQKKAASDLDTIDYWNNYIKNTGPMLIEDRRKRVEVSKTGIRKISKIFYLDNDIQKLAQALDVPLKIILQGLYLEVLRNFFGVKSVVSGVVTHCRLEDENIDQNVGLFLNTLPLKYTFVDKTFKMFAKDLIEQEIDRLKYRAYPLDKICEEGILFDHAMNFTYFDNYFSHLKEFPSLVKSVKIEEETSFKLFFNFSIDPISGQLELRIDADQNYFTENHIEELFRAFNYSINTLNENHNRNIITSPAFKNVESRNSMNGGGVDLNSWTNNVSIKLALINRHQQLTYQELFSEVQKLVQVFKTKNINRGDKVVISIPRGNDLIINILALTQINAIIIPVPWDVSENRKNEIITLSKPQFIINEREIIQCENESLSSLNLLFYILFTSGSTGKPKGVMMSRNGFSHFMNWQIHNSHFEQNLTTLQFASIGFDVSFQEIFATLLTGGTLVTLTEDERFDLSMLPQLIEERAIERVFVPFVVLNTLCEIFEIKKTSLIHLKEVITAGEQLEVTDDLRNFFIRHNNTRLFNQYGPTETHVVTEYILDSDPKSWDRLPSLGKALPEVEYQIIATGETLNSWSPYSHMIGELWLQCPSLAEGYLASEIESKRFVFSEGKRWYNTGDYVCLNEKEELVYLGRRDDQVKINGIRIELAEVESKLRQCKLISGDTVLEAAAWVEQGKILKAAVVFESRATNLELADDLKEVLSSQVFSALIPTQIKVMKELPVNKNGKVDRAMLINDKQLSLKVELTLHEERIFKIWKKILKSDQLNPELNFVQNGANSLAVVRLLALLEKEFNCKISLKNLMQKISLKQQVELILIEEKINSVFAPLNKINIEVNPYFCIHPIGGTSFCYQTLNNELSSLWQGTFYVAEQLEIPEFNSVENLASFYIKEMQKIKPKGPYQIGGWSFGGIVAYEMAQQLKAMGEEVVSLILIDSIALNREMIFTVAEKTKLEWFFWELLGAENDYSDYSIEQIFASEVYTREMKLDLALQVAEENGWYKNEWPMPTLLKLLTVFENNLNALFSYTPKPYLGSLILLRSSELMPNRLKAVHEIVGSLFTDPTNGWSDLVTSSKLKVNTVTGNHVSIMFAPHAQNVAVQMASVLN